MAQQSIDIRLKAVAVILLLGLIVLYMTAFTVDQRQFAVVFQFEEYQRTISEPGLKFKLPIVQKVRYFDRRILTMENNDPERFITSEKKNVLVDFFVKWRIKDPKQYYLSVRGDEVMARIRLAQTVNAGLREEFGKRSVHDVISGERNKIMEEMRGKADADAAKIGVQIVDVRLKRVEFPVEISEAVYQQMRAERTRVANELRSTGFAESEKIRANADRQREVILAEAYRDAQKIKGEGDAKAAAIYAGAFSQNPEFYAFYRSLEAYRNTFKSKSDLILLDPESEFFKYMKDLATGGEQ